MEEPEFRLEAPPLAAPDTTPEVEAPAEAEEAPPPADELPCDGWLTNEELVNSLYQPMTMLDKSRSSSRI